MSGPRLAEAVRAVGPCGGGYVCVLTVSVLGTTGVSFGPCRAICWCGGSPSFMSPCLVWCPLDEAAPASLGSPYVRLPEAASRVKSPCVHIDLCVPLTNAKRIGARNGWTARGFCACWRPPDSWRAGSCAPRSRSDPAARGALHGRGYHRSARRLAPGRADDRVRPPRRPTMPALVQESVTITIHVGHDIGGDLHVPDGATGLVVFAHGSGSSRFSSRNRAVAASLHARGLGTLLLDLLTEQEARSTPSRRRTGSMSPGSAAASWWPPTGSSGRRDFTHCRLAVTARAPARPPL